MVKNMITAIVQARMGSERLPNKMLLPIAGKPMLQRVVERLRWCSKIDNIMIATTVMPSDDQLVRLAHKLKIGLYRGSENDLVDRFYQAAKLSGADIIVRIWGDCPFIDPDVIDSTISILEQNQLDFCSNIHPATFPRGLDVEVFTFTSLEKTWNETKDKFYREYMSNYMFENTDKFKTGTLTYTPDLSDINLCVDYKQDLIFANKIFSYFNNDGFSMQQVLDFIRAYPDIMTYKQGLKRYEDYKEAIKARNDACGERT